MSSGVGQTVKSIFVYMETVFCVFAAYQVTGTIHVV